jgi:hypothetical protein
MDKTITHESGTHRLTIHFAAESQGRNFHSLAWEVFAGSRWSDHVVISREVFQAPTRHRRWISNLHSFDPDAGRAIIQIAEGDVPIGVLPVHYTYSWREWDLLHNRELRLLSVCTRPFDKYEPSA